MEHGKTLGLERFRMIALILTQNDPDQREDDK
jgi:hypothetical protein